MKKLFLFLTLSSLVFSSVSRAVEYVILVDDPGVNVKNQIILDPTDVVEIIGYAKDNEADGMYMYRSLNGENKEFIYRPNYRNSSSGIGSIFTGLEKIRLFGCTRLLTLKITKASEINKVGPTSVLVLPENATGNYDLIVESSSDSVTRTPFHSQAVQSDTVKRLFRVRIVHKGQEEAKAKAKKN